MKSRISFFNLALFRKDITRFTPLWVIYTVGMSLLMVSLMSVGWGYVSELDRAAHRVYVLSESIGPMGIMNLLYGMLAAQLLFGELFNSRLCNALHAMPVSREARFGSHLVAGLAFSIVPNLVVSLLLMPNLNLWWYTALLWWGAMTLEYLFFFGVAMLSMQCTGNRFAAILVYAIINFGAMAALWFASVIFVPMMPGVVLNAEAFALYSPVVKLCTLSNWLFVEVVENTYYFQWGESWPVLWGYGAVGLVSVIGAVLLYRRRALECAGDFMAVRALKPVFLLIYTLCVGAFLAVFGSLFGGDTSAAFLLTGFAIGFFTGAMLLDRSIRVFTRKHFLQLGVLAAVMILSFVAVQGDWFGIVRYVPDAGSVKEVQLERRYYGSERVKVSDPEQLELVCKAHGLALTEEGCKHGDAYRYEITYHMKDGRTIIREYTLCGQTEAALTLEGVLSSPVALLGIEGSFEDYVKSVTDIEVEGMIRRQLLNKVEQEELLTYIIRDCRNGSMGAAGGAISRFEVTIWRGKEQVRLTIREQSQTYEQLKAYDYNDVLAYRDGIKTITLNEKVIDEERYGDLVMALYEDAKDHYIEGWDIFLNPINDGAFVLMVNEGLAGEEKLHIGDYTRNTYEWVKDYLYETGEFE